MTKRGRLALLGTLALQELQEQARVERLAASDDDEPRVPNPLDSAQSRRAAMAS